MLTNIIFIIIVVFASLLILRPGSRRPHYHNHAPYNPHLPPEELMRYHNQMQYFEYVRRIRRRNFIALIIVLILLIFTLSGAFIPDAT